MAKVSGIGMGAAIAGYNLATDIGALDLGGGPAPIEVPGLTSAGMERIGGLVDGRMNFSAYFNDAAGQAHAALSGLPTTDVQAIVFLSSTIGAPAACMVGKQLDYAPSRNADGSLPISIPIVGNGYGLEWGRLLTAGWRTDSSATNGASLDGGAASTTGWAAYLQVLDVTGTNVVVTLEDSADDTSFATFTGSAFTSVTTDRTVQRLDGGTTATVRRYVRAVTSGTFSSAQFIVAFTRRPIGS